MCRKKDYNKGTETTQQQRTLNKQQANKPQKDKRIIRRSKALKKVIDRMMGDAPKIVGD